MMLKLIIKAVFILVLVLQVSRATKRCDGENEYVENHKCQKCQVCLPGFEPTLHHCGYGSKNPLYSCKPCDRGYYSSLTGYQFCTTCSPCAKWHSSVVAECTASTDAKCGSCFVGYYRPKKSDGSPASECHPCDADSDHPACQRQSVDWKVIAIIMSGVVVILVFSSMACCCLWKRANNTACAKPTTKSNKRRGAALFRKSGDSEVATSQSLEPLTTSCEGLQTQIQPELAKPPEGNTYSFLPTAEWNDNSCLQTHLYRPAVLRPNVVHHPGAVNSVAGESMTASTNRLDDHFEINVDAFDTESVHKSLAHDQGFQESSMAMIRQIS